MQFYSLEPISLSLPKKGQIDPGCSFPDTGHSLASANTFRMRESINAINLYYNHLEALKGHITDGKRSTRRTPLVRIFDAANEKWKSTPLYALLCWTFAYLVIVIHFCAERVSRVLNWSPLGLVNLSATAQQIDLRCQQFCYFPVQYKRITENADLTPAQSQTACKEESARGSSTPNTFPCEFYPDYIRFYNTIWLIVNDVSFGLTVGTFLRENRHFLARFLNFHLTHNLFYRVRFVTTFLGNNPFGIKLNGELARFLSDLFLWIIDFSFSTYINHIVSIRSIEIFISIISQTCCYFGVSFGLALVVDLLSILSMHISLFYFISAKMYHWQLHVMRSLLYLFWGKKRNVLRNRVDSNMFELDQLLMGTLFFTVMVFLLPTLSIFYAFFTILRMTILMPELLLESIMALLNHFPLFVLLLRIKDPKRIPGGVCMRVLKLKNRFAIFNNPLTISDMFRPYAVLMGVMTDSYFSVATLKQILGGQPITVKRRKMYQVLYSALPATPIATRVLWAALKTTLP